MKFPLAAVRKVAAKRHRAPETSEARASAPPPKRIVVRAPNPPQEPSAIQAVDLTVDTPPETAVEVTPPEVAAEEQPTRGPAVEPTGEPGTLGEPSLPRTGEEPGASGPPPEEATIPPRAVPMPAEAAESSRSRPVARGASLMSDGRRAVRLMAQIIQPDFQEELRGIGATRFFREAASAIVRVANSLALTYEAIGEGDAVMNQLQTDVEGAQAQAEAAERALEATRASCAEEIKRAEDRASVAVEQQRLASNRLAEVEGAIEARNLHIADLKSLLQAAKENMGKAEDEARRAEERAKKAEENEGRANERAKRAEETGMEATALLTAERESRASEIEAAVRAGAAKAVEDFRSSDLFAWEVLEGNADSYLEGFREAKEKIARVLGVPGALEISPDGDLDEASPGGSAAGP